MIDIVERIRENQCPDIMNCNVSPYCSCADLKDAADTIDQLRAELVALREAHWAHSNPGLADQYRAEAFACRRALGFDVDSEEVSPRELIDAIKAQPAIPEGWVLEAAGEFIFLQREDSKDDCCWFSGAAEEEEERLAYAFFDAILAAKQENNNGN
jgi:hypothetical protein